MSLSIASRFLRASSTSASTLLGDLYSLISFLYTSSLRSNCGLNTSNVVHFHHGTCKYIVLLPLLQLYLYLVKWVMLSKYSLIRSLNYLSDLLLMLNYVLTYLPSVAGLAFQTICRTIIRYSTRTRIRNPQVRRPYPNTIPFEF